MPVWGPEIETKGFYEWHATVARKPIIGLVTLEGLADFASWDTSIVWDEFPKHVDVLTVHGILDSTVPV